jgi:hypothetical protein
MTFQDDIQTDISDIIYDTDEFAITATWYSKKTGITSQSFSCIVGEAVFHGDEETDIIHRERVSLSSPISNIEDVKKRDIITLNNIEYEAIGDTYLNSSSQNIGIIQLRRKIETKI